MTYNQQLARIAELYHLSEQQTKQLDMQIHMAVLTNPVQTIYDIAQQFIDKAEKERTNHETTISTNQLFANHRHAH